MFISFTSSRQHTEYKEWFRSWLPHSWGTQKSWNQISGGRDFPSFWFLIKLWLQVCMLRLKIWSQTSGCVCPHVCVTMLIIITQLFINSCSTCWSSHIGYEYIQYRGQFIQWHGCSFTAGKSHVKPKKICFYNMSLNCFWEKTHANVNATGGFYCLFSWLPRMFFSGSVCNMWTAWLWCFANNMKTKGRGTYLCLGLILKLDLHVHQH